MWVVGISVKHKTVFALVWILLVSIILSTPNFTSDEYLLSRSDESVALDTNSISEGQEGPTMRYYLRRYNPKFVQRPNFTLTIFVEDHDGVDAVTMMYSQKNGDFENISMSTQDIGVWQNVTMDHKIDSWYETTILISNLTEPYFWCSYLVKYAANDSLGNLEISPLCIYIFYDDPVTADCFGIELYDTPDLWYVARTTNHTITWDVAPDSHSQSGWSYILFENGHRIEFWDWGGGITIDVDGLGIGNHIFELYIQVVLSSNSKDTVMVHVVETPEEIPSSASTGSVGPLTEVSDTTTVTEVNDAIADPSIPVLAVGLSFVAVIILWKRRRT